MIRIKFDEDSIQEEYLSVKLAISKLSEILFTLGTYASMLKSNKDDEQEIGLRGIQHIVSLFGELEPPSTVEDAYESMENIVRHIIINKLLNSVDTIVYIAVQEANKGRASTSSIEGDLVDLIVGNDIHENEIERLLSLVENVPVKKIEA